MMNRWSSVYPAGAALVLVGLVFVLTLAVLPKDGFWVVDGAGKFLQVKAILRSHYTDLSIPWQGAAADPSFLCNPLPFPFSEVRSGRLYSLFPPAFAVLSSVPYAVFGAAGLYLIPVAGSLLMLVGLARLAKTLKLGPHATFAAVALAGLGTPVWFYSVTFWEHMAAVALCVWGLYFSVRFLATRALRDLVIAAALGALAAWFRDEAYLFCAAMVLVVLLHAPGIRLKACAAAGVAALAVWTPLWLFQWLALGHPLGMHATSHLGATPDAITYLKSRPRVFFWQFLASHPDPWISLLLSVPFFAVFVLNPLMSRSRTSIGVPVLCASAGLLAAGALVGYLGAGPLTRMFQSSNSLFVAAPLTMLAFVRLPAAAGDEEGEAASSFLWMTLLLFGALYVLCAPVIGLTGIHWGNRHLLVYYPLAALLAVRNLERWAASPTTHRRASVSCVVFLLAVTVAAQMLSVGLLVRKQAFSTEANRAIQRLPSRVLVTNVWWVPQELFSVFDDRMVFYVKTPGQLEAIKPRLRAMGISNFLFVTHAMKEDSPDVVLSMPCDVDPYFSMTVLRGTID